jgi:hypothetical protein
VPTLLTTGDLNSEVEGLAPQEQRKYELSNGESGRGGILRLLTTRANSEMRPSRMGVSPGDSIAEWLPGTSR